MCFVDGVWRTRLRLMNQSCGVISPKQSNQMIDLLFCYLHEKRHSDDGFMGFWSLIFAKRAKRSFYEEVCCIEL